MKKLQLFLISFILILAPCPSWAGWTPAVGGPGGAESDPLVNALGKAVLPCSLNQIPKMGAQGWGCSSDETAESGGDMLKSTYDVNTDGVIDDAAIPTTIARDSEIPTKVSDLTNDSGFISSVEADTWNGAAISSPGTAETARATLGLGSAAILNAGTGTSNVIIGNDYRLSNARTPTAHTQAWSTINPPPTTLSLTSLTVEEGGIDVTSTAATDGKWGQWVFKNDAQTQWMLFHPKDQTGVTENFTVDIINSSGDLVTRVAVPETATSTCVSGVIASDDSYDYKCTAANTWKRSARTWATW